MSSSRLVIAGLGPGDPASVPKLALMRARGAGRVFVRTERHPSVSFLRRKGVQFETFDSLYDQAESFDQLYAAICERVLESARRFDTVYMVPGNPLVGEKTVQMILDAFRRDQDLGTAVQLEIIPAMSFVDGVLQAVGYAATSGYLLVDAYDLYQGESIYLPPHAPCIIFQVHDTLLVSTAKLWLLDFLPPHHTIYVVRAAGVSGLQEIHQVPLEELDRSRIRFDHVTSLFVPPASDTCYGTSQGAWTRFLALLSQLRGENGCPWDKQQDYESLTKFVIEEAYEVVSAVLEKDSNKLKEELGDLLLEVGLYCQIASERQEFRARDVLDAIIDKIVRRHPHVFAGERLSRAEDVERRWEEIKQSESTKPEPEASLMDRLEEGFPALIKAQKQQELVSTVGFDWESPEPVFAKVREETYELESAWKQGHVKAIGDEVGDLLYACVNLARHLGVDAETALLTAVHKFAKRFRQVEQELRARGISLESAGIRLLDELWGQVKMKEDHQ